MPKLSNRQPQDLPQHDQVWHAFVFKMHSWVTERNKPPERPYCMMILDLTTGLMMAADIAPAVTPEWIGDAISKAITKPLPGAKPHRPKTITLPDESLIAQLAPRLSEIGVECQHMDTPEEVFQIVAEMESQMRGGEPDIPGLLSVEGVTPDVAGDLFAAATEFYRAAPWVRLYNVQGLAIRLATETEPRYVSVMGNAGVEYGLSVSPTWDDFRRMASGAVEHFLDAIPAGGAHSLLFNEMTHVPFDDLDAIDQYGWQTPDQNTVPVPIIFKREGSVSRPDRQEVLWYQATLRAIPIFVREHLRSDGRGDYSPAEASIVVPTSDGETTVIIRYPAGELDRASEPAVEMEWQDEFEDEKEDDGLLFDRRIMEGQLASMSRQAGGEPLYADKKLQKAQELMYQAWEEQNPGKRLTLAHQALSTSPDCADAYVLLAEEEADTVGRALELYQQGVAAGERALSEHWQELVGNFWAAIETRPYMRARLGSANTLWRLGQREEAQAHYEEMLRLNPDDNQGVRYMLLGVLLELDRDAEVLNLLDQYRDDVMAPWNYTRALIEFRRGGASDKANRALRVAVRQNKHVPPYLTGEKRVPNRRPDYIGMGDENEAISYVADHLNHWRRTEGAVDWLRDQLATQSKTAQAKKEKGPSRIDLIEAAMAEATGPVKVDELVQYMVARKSSKAKDPAKAFAAYLREPYSAKPFAFLDQDTVLPVRLALQGVRFRITLDRQMVRSGAVEFYPYFCPFLRDLRAFSGPQLMPTFENDRGVLIPAELTTLRVEAEGLFGEPEMMDVQAVDLKAWLSALAARRGDSLLLTVLDWEQGRFQLVFEPQRRRKKEVAQQNRALADLIYELLEATRDEELWIETGLTTAYARLPSARDYPGDHWTDVLENDGRMDWEDLRIFHADSERSSLFDMFLSEEEEEAVEEKPFTAQQGRQVYRFRASRGKKEFVIETQGKHTLGDLDAAMKETFNLDPFDHLSEFTLVTPRGKGKQARRKPFGSLDPLGEYPAHKVHIAGLGLEVGAQLEYLYDFGDNIKHKLVLDAIEEPEKGGKYPRYRKASGEKRQ